jgi:glycosyltransferase involved in cell wall biosynthesis
MLVAWRLGVPIVGSFSADFSSTSLGQRYVRALSKKCERVLTHSAAARDRLTAAGVEPSRIATWRPGVDTHIFTPSKRSAGLRERWEVSDVRPAVAYVGALSDEKCSHRLVSLEMGLRRSHPMHRLIVVGDGPGRAELEYRCDQAVFMGTLTRDCRSAGIGRSVRLPERNVLDLSRGARGSSVGPSGICDGARQRA